MNICYIIRSFCARGGTESYVYNMSVALAKSGHQVHIVSISGKGQWDMSGLEDKIFIHEFNLKEQVFRGSWRIEKFLPLFTWRYLALINKVLPDLIKKHAIDIIEVPDWSFDTLYYLPRREVPVCVRLHGYPGFKEDFDKGIIKKWPKNYIIWSLSRKHLLNVEFVTSVSKSYTDFVKEVWDVKKKNFSIIPIGINLELFHPADIAREDKSVLFAGRLERSKGIEVLAQAIPMILRSAPQTKFYLAGKDFQCNGGPMTWSQYLIKLFGNKNIVYLGVLSAAELIRYYQTVTLSVMPSLYEPGGTIAFEAMACGCPMIASNVGGLPEIIKDRQTGLLVPAQDPWALADAVTDLLQNTQLRDDISQKAIESIQKDYNLNKIVQQTLNVYVNAIQSFKSGKV